MKLWKTCTLWIHTVHLSRPFNPSIHFPRIFNSQNNQHMAESDIRVGDPVLSWQTVHNDGLANRDCLILISWHERGPELRLFLMGDREMMIKLTGGLDPVADVAVLLVSLAGRVHLFHPLKGGGEEPAVSVRSLGERLLGQDEWPCNEVSILTEPGRQEKREQSQHHARPF